MTDVSAGFRPPCWSSPGWAPAWRLHTKLYKFVLNISSDISYTNYFFEPNLGEGLRIFTSFHFPDSRLYLSNSFDFYFDLFWMAWHWKPSIGYYFPGNWSVGWRFSGTFHSIPKIPEIFVGTWNGTDHFGLVRPEYSGPALKVVHFDRSGHFGRSNFPFA